MRTNTNSKAIDYFIVVIIIFMALVFGLFVVQCGMNMAGLLQSRATNSAHEWAKRVGIEPESITCNRSDTDADGYISCTFNMGNNDIEQYECSYDLIFVDGCRQPKASVRINNTTRNRN